MMLRAYLKAVATAVCASAFALLSPASASADPVKDIQATARVLTFLENDLGARVVIGVVFDPARSESVAEKNAIIAAIGDGYSVGRLTVVGKPMEAGAIHGVKVIFVTHGVDFAAVGAETRAKRIIVVGSDFACVRSGACAIGIATDPTVQIVVNRNALAAAGAALKAAFRMMIHEI